MKTVEVRCDGCDKDLTTRSNMVDYRLVLSSESKPGYGAGAYTAMHISPPVDRDYHFCDLRCLDLWRDRERHEGSLWRAWWDDWKDKNGTKRDDGRVYSYPDPPAETREAKNKEFEAAALAAFPMARPKRS